MPDLLEQTNTGGGDRALIETAETVSIAPEPTARTEPPVPEQRVGLLGFDQVSKWYGPVIGLNEVSFDLKPGVTGLVGSNGAGKSTLMKLATGMLRPELGTVSICGHSAWSSEAKNHLGFCPETDSFYEEMSGREFVVTMARLMGYHSSEAKDRTENALRQVEMTDRAKKRIRGYSKGMRQRIKLAQALVHDPDLLVLDEPLNGIDPVGRIEMGKLFHDLAADGKSILISSHLLEELERLTSRVMVIARGRMIAHGTLTEIRDLMEQHPLAIRIDCDRPREMAQALLHVPEVLGVELNGGSTLVARAYQPQRFFPAFSNLVLDNNFDVDHLETLDDSAQAILDYVMKGGI